jgi:hypothetical protein
MEIAMTRTTLIAAVTASVLGSLAMTATAEAGGIRLGFGGPMASFVASPTHGGGGNSYQTASNYGRGGDHCAKKRPSYSVASRPHSEPRVVARSEPKPAHRDKVQVASVQHETWKPKASTAATDAVIEKAADKAEVASDTNSGGLTGSKALAQTDTAATTAAAADAAKSDAVVVAETPDAMTEATPAPAVKAEEPAKDVGCKKFIPSVGVTIDVGCDK